MGGALLTLRRCLMVHKNVCARRHVPPRTYRSHSSLSLLLLSRPHRGRDDTHVELGHGGPRCYAWRCRNRPRFPRMAHTRPHWLDLVRHASLLDYAGLAGGGIDGGEVNFHWAEIRHRPGASGIDPRLLLPPSVIHESRKGHEDRGRHFSSSSKLESGPRLSLCPTLHPNPFSRPLLPSLKLNECCKERRNKIDRRNLQTVTPCHTSGAGLRKRRHSQAVASC